MSSIELPTKFVKLESDMSVAKGDFAFFALFLPDGLIDRWDLMISAPWASEDEKGALEYFVNRIKADLGLDALIQLSQIIFIDPNNVELRKLNRAVHVEHGAIELRDRDIFGVTIKLAFIITSKDLVPLPPVDSVAHTSLSR